MTSKIIRALAYNDEIRVFVIDGLEVVETARKTHETWYTATAAMGRMIMATSLLAANLKGSDRLVTVIEGQGPIGRIVVHGNSHGETRAAIDHPHVSLPLNEQGKIDVSAGIGLPGFLTVSKYIENMEPFNGTVELISGEIAEDFTYYLAVSEQTPSAMGLSVLVDADEHVLSAGGFLIQVLPGASEETIQQLEKTIQQIGRLSDKLQSGLTSEKLLDYLVGEGNSRIIATQDITYHCPCDKAFYADKLMLLGESELQLLIDEQRQAEVVCHYCSKHYDFSQSELETLIERIHSKETE